MGRRKAYSRESTKSYFYILLQYVSQRLQMPDIICLMYVTCDSGRSFRVVLYEAYEAPILSLRKIR